MQLAPATAAHAPFFHGRPGPVAATGPDARIGARRSFMAEEEIYAEGERAVHVYRVVSGAVRTYRLLCDGRRQIDGFHLPGDIFGLEAGDARRFSADAVSDAVVTLHRRGDPATEALARDVIDAMMRMLERAQDHMMLLGRKSARERVASFLLGLSRRMAADGVVDLPMSRLDIADHLGLTIESVSRSFTQLEREGVIALHDNRRAVLLRDKATLRRLDA